MRIPVFGVKLDGEPKLAHVYHQDGRISLCGRLLRDMTTESESTLPTCHVCAELAKTWR